jgi:hypothetical protein
MGLKTFNKYAKCPKCGGTDISAAWQAGTNRCPRRKPCKKYSNGTPCTFEHIDRYCRSCRYMWVELPLDSTSGQMLEVLT